MALAKFRNTKTVLDGFTFDSAKEARRYAELKLLQRAGKISDLRRQVSYPLTINGVQVAKLIADFDYRDGPAVVVEDTKSDFTRKLPVWRLKSKMFRAIYGFPIREV